MPLPATRFALPYVGGPRDQGSDPAARPDPQIHRLLWCGQPAHRAVRAHDVPGVQRRDLPALSQATAAPAYPPPPHDPRARQCALPSCRTAATLPASGGYTPALAVPATLQPAARLDRAGLEAHAAPGDSQ